MERVLDSGAGATVCDAVISIKYNNLCFTARTKRHKHTGGGRGGRRGKSRAKAEGDGEGAAEPRGDVVNGHGELFKGRVEERAAARASECTSRMRSTLCAISRPSVTTRDDRRYQMIRLAPVRVATTAASSRCSETTRISADKGSRERKKLREFIFLQF